MEIKDLEEKFKTLSARSARCATEVAVLSGMQQEKRKQREALEVELKAAGVDIANLEGEEKRLRQSVEEALNQLDLDLAATESSITKLKESK